MELKPAQRSQYRAFRALYHSAFPASERQPFAFMLRQWNKGLAQLYAATDEAGAFVGLAVLVPGDHLVLINYLAVVPSARGSGLGSRMLSAIRDLYPDERLVLEIETPDPAAPNGPLRVRREEFYLRNGYTRTGVRLQIGGNDMTLLSLGGPVSFREYCDLQRGNLGPLIWKTLNVRLLHGGLALDEPLETPFAQYACALPEADAAKLRDFFADLSRHLALPAGTQAQLRADFEQALVYYHRAGLALDDALELLRVENLGGFYARPPILWYPLDDAAKIYPMSMRYGRMSVFRQSVYLTAPVVPEILQMALNFVIKRFPSFATTLKKGFFWHYLDARKGRFAVLPETDAPCSPLPIASSGSQSFRVLYHHNRFSVEYFHVLTDGAGGMVFLKALLGEYLRLLGVDVRYTHGVADPNAAPAPGETANEFPQTVEAKKTAAFLSANATQMSGRLSSHKPCQIIHLKLDAQQLHAVAKSRGASVTAYLLAQMFLAGKYATDEPRGLHSIQVPVDMRKFYPSDTVRNFAMYCSVDLPLEEITDAVEILPRITAQLREKTVKEPMSEMMSATARMVSAIRYIPLFIKAPVARVVYGFLGDPVISNTLSNLGVVKLPESFGPHVQSMDFVLGTLQTNRVGCSLVTCGNVATLSIAKMTADPSFEERLAWLLEQDGLSPTVEGSELYET